MKALITGCNGFVGKWLIDYLSPMKYRLFGLDIQKESDSDIITYRQGNLLDANAMTDTISAIKPDLLFHLAAISFLPQADKSPRLALDINLGGTITLLEALRTVSPDTKLLLVGSAKEYNDNIYSVNIEEEVSPAPTNFYGITKYAGEMIGMQYHRQFGLDVRCTRSFNHTGPGQSPDFVCSDWARQVVLINHGKNEPYVTVGDISPAIDFSDVRDVVAAYHAILTRGKAGEVYNVCSGTGVDLSWILSYLCNKADREIAIKNISEKIRNHKSNKKIIGSHEKLTDHTGWKPAIPFRKTLDDLYEFWNKQQKVSDGSTAS